MDNIQEKLKKAFEYYKKLKREYDFSFCFGSISGYNDLFVDKKEVRVKFYKYFLKLFNFDKLPIIENDKNYNSIDKVQMYHGFLHYAHSEQFLKDNDIFDFGFVPSGFYVTNDEEYASFMTSVEGKYNARAWLEDYLSDKIFEDPKDKAEDIKKFCLLNSPLTKFVNTLILRALEIEFWWVILKIFLCRIIRILMNF